MNCHVTIGWLAGSSEIFVSSDFRQGRQIASELRKSKAWREIYSGSLIDLISKLKEGKGK